MAKLRRYAQVGLGGRSEMYTQAVTKTYKDTCELVGLCDTNQGRMDLVNRKIVAAGGASVPTFAAAAFEQMVAQTRPDVVIVTSMDVTHSDYICRAMELGCDVVTEKPMTTDEARCRRILQTAKATGRSVRVTFNYRYSPPRSQVKGILASGAIGDIYSVDFCWLLDTRHGADYFRRWHRNRDNSGSLLVHKATHHFDLVNWWLGDAPEDVFCHASRRYYTPATAQRMGVSACGERCRDCADKARCKFHLDMAAFPSMKEMYLDCETHDGYVRDRCIFSDQINIWDNMSVSARYQGGAILNYMLHAYSPYEGYRIAFNGSKGRLEHNCCENTYISGDGSVPGELQKGATTITLIPEFSPPQVLEVHSAAGGHGGGDPVLLDDIFLPDRPHDPLGRAATQRDGAYSIMVGIAAYHSIDQHKPVSISGLLAGAPI